MSAYRGPGTRTSTAVCTSWYIPGAEYDIIQRYKEQCVQRETNICDIIHINTYFEENILLSLRLCVYVYYTHIMYTRTALVRSTTAARASGIYYRSDTAVVVVIQQTPTAAVGVCISCTCGGRQQHSSTLRLQPFPVDYKRRVMLS